MLWTTNISVLSLYYMQSYLHIVRLNHLIELSALVFAQILGLYQICLFQIWPEPDFADFNSKSVGFFTVATN